MNTSVRRFAVALLVAVTASAAAGYWFARRHPPAANPTAAAAARKPLYWYDPMVPNQHFDRPGKSPFMDMQLIPRFADETQRAGVAAQPASVRIDPGVLQNLGVRTTPVERGPLSQPIDVVGMLGFNQRSVAVVQARSNGFVARVYSRAPGDVLGRNAPIADLLIPEWVGAQAEFIALLKSGERDLIEAARQRLLLLGMADELIADVEKSREPRATVTIRSPLAGVIETLDVWEGMTVSAGATLAKINGLATVWLEAAVPEARGDLAQLGKNVEARLTAYPGRTFTGSVIAVLPQTNVETRTLRVRIELANPDGRLKPGMFAQVKMEAGQQTAVLFVSSEAIIRTGSRQIAIVAAEQGRFIPTRVQVGADVGGKTIILDGLMQGQRVVASGQFLIDSEASLNGVLARLAGGSGGAGHD